MISEMSVGRHECFAVVIPTTNEIMVVGGSDGRHTHVDSVEFASLI